MSTIAKPISPLRQRMLEDMRLRKLGEKTQSGYIRGVKNFTRYLGRAPDTATAEDLRRYQLQLAEQGVSRTSINAAVTALRFFFDVTLGRAQLVAKMSHVHQPRKLPQVLSGEEITRLLEAAPGLKYRAALSVAYGAGLRAAEVVSLKVSDIDSQRMVIRVEQGKGRRDRLLVFGLSHRRIPKLFRGGYRRISRIACPGGIAVEDGAIREALAAAVGMRVGKASVGGCCVDATTAGAGPPSWSQNGRVSSGTNRSGWRSGSQWNLRSTWDSRAGR